MNLPPHKYKRGDLVEYHRTQYVVQHISGHRKIGDGEWKPIYTLCPLNKTKTLPDRRSWKAKYSSFKVNDVQEEFLVLIKTSFYHE